VVRVVVDSVVVVWFVMNVDVVSRKVVTVTMPDAETGVDGNTL
jgi:hypothetical protein